MSTVQDRIYLYDSDRSIIERIENDTYFNFKNKSRKEQFMFLMAIGANSGIEIEPSGAKDAWFHVKDLQAEDEALMLSLALNKTNDIEVITQTDKVFKIAERYAHTGVKILNDKIKSTALGTFEKQFELEITSIYNGIIGEKIIE